MLLLVSKVILIFYSGDKVKRASNNGEGKKTKARICVLSGWLAGIRMKYISDHIVISRVVFFRCAVDSLQKCPCVGVGVYVIKTSEANDMFNVLFYRFRQESFCLFTMRICEEIRLIVSAKHGHWTNHRVLVIDKKSYLDFNFDWNFRT